jgi:hypothetical protein
MKKLYFILLLSILVGGFVPSSQAARRSSNKSNYNYSSPRSESVRGYTRKDGTYVQPYRRSIGNSTRRDNWSTKGNINPYTGKKGTKNQ